MLIKARFRFPEIAFGMLLAVAIFAMGAVFSSQPSPQKSTNNESTESAKHISPPSSADERIADYTEALAWLTAVLAAVSIFQGAMLLRAERVARESNKLTAKLFADEQRPLLALSDPEIILDGRSGVMFRVSATNIGKTLARNVDVRFKVTRGVPVPSNRIVDTFARGRVGPSEQDDFLSIVYPQGMVQLSHVEGDGIPANTTRHNSCRLVFCVIYQADGTAGPLRAAGEIIFADRIVGEVDEEGWGNAHFYPHNFRVTYAD